MTLLEQVLNEVVLKDELKKILKSTSVNNTSSLADVMPHDVFDNVLKLLTQKNVEDATDMVMDQVADSDGGQSSNWQGIADDIQSDFEHITGKL